MRKNILLVPALMLASLFFTSCNKNPYLGIVPPGTQGVYVIDQGRFQLGNGEITFYNPVTEQLTNNLFYGVNGFHPGDILESMYMVDSFGFIVVNNSQKILEVKIPSFNYIRTDTILNGSPRYFLPVNDSIAYITDLYQGEVHVLNYRAGSVVSQIRGLNQWTEHMLPLGNNVIVEEDIFGTPLGRSDTLDSLAVINITTNTVTGQFTYPGGGPGGIVLDYQNRIWMASNENAAAGIHAAIYCLNSDMSINKKIVFPTGHHPTNLCIDGAGQKLYFLDSGVFYITIDDVLVPTDPFVAEGGHNFYGLGVNPANGDVYVSDAKNYTQNSVVYRYDQNANQLYMFTAGLISGNFTFNTQ